MFCFTCYGLLLSVLVRPVLSDTVYLVCSVPSAIFTQFPVCTDTLNTYMMIVCTVTFPDHDILSLHLVL